MTPRLAPLARGKATCRWTLRAIVSALAIAIGLFAIGVALVYAQNPMLLRWDKAAPFPEAEEELYGV
ncbi:MAG TPA: hypothetical protein VGJ78_20075, partial [Vicinamibacterales bacterium]